MTETQRQAADLAKVRALIAKLAKMLRKGQVL